MRYLFLTFALLMLNACGNTVQTTSGRDYLAAYVEPAGGPDGAKSVAVTDEIVRKAAGVEPILRFPARLGLARMEGGRLTGIPRKLRKREKNDRMTARALEALAPYVETVSAMLE